MPPSVHRLSTGAAPPMFSAGAPSRSAAAAAHGPLERRASDYLEPTAAHQPRRLSTGAYPSVFEMPTPSHEPEQHTMGFESHVPSKSVATAAATAGPTRKRRSEQLEFLHSDSASRDSSVKRESHSPPRSASPARSISPPAASKRARLSGPLDSLAAAASSVLSSSAPPQTMGLGFITDDSSPRHSASARLQESIPSFSRHASEADLRRQSVVGAPTELVPEVAGAPRPGRSKGPKQRQQGTTHDKETTLGKRRGGDAREKTRHLTVAVGPLERPGLEYSPVVPPPPRSAPPKSSTPSVLLPVPEKGRAQPSPLLHSAHPVDPGIGPKQRRQSASAMSPTTYTAVHQLPAGQSSYSALSSYKLPQPTQLPTPVRPDYPRATGSFSGRPTSSHSMTHSLSGGGIDTTAAPRPSSAGGRERGGIPPHVYHHSSSQAAHGHPSAMAGYYTSPPQYRFIQPPPSPTSRTEAAPTPRQPLHSHLPQPPGGPRSPPLAHHHHYPHMSAASASKQAFIGFLSSWYDTMTAETRHLSRQLEDQVRRSSALMSALQSTLDDVNRERRKRQSIQVGAAAGTSSNEVAEEFGREFDKRMSDVTGDLTKEIEAFATRLDKCEQSIQAEVGFGLDEERLAARRESIGGGVPMSLVERLDKLERALGQVTRRISDGSASGHASARRHSRTSVAADVVEDFDEEVPSDDDVRRKLSSDSGSTAGTMVQQPPVMRASPESSEKVVASVVQSVEVTATARAA
ncbi:hypothetical protein ACM66B_006540 [Microbotryomycetes sp. NB124-2]